MRAAVRMTGLGGAVLAVLALGACAPDPITISAGLGVAQQGAAAFFKGELQAAYRRPMGEVIEAVRSAVKSLMLKPETDRVENRVATITAREDGGRLIEISTERNSSVLTSLRIRVGLLGDQAISRVFLDEVQKALGEAPPPDQP